MFGYASNYDVKVLQGQLKQLSSVLREVEAEVAKLRDEMAILRTMVR